MSNDNLDDLFAKLEADMEPTERLCSQGHRALLSGDTQQAAQCFQEAIGLGLSHPKAFRDLAAAHMKLEQPARAVEALRRALELETDWLLARGIHRELSRAYQAMGDEESAQRHYRAFQAATVEETTD